MYNLDQKIEEYTEELFVDLGLTQIPEDEKAEVFARMREQFHKVILATLSGAVSPHDLSAIEHAMEQENYDELSKIIKRYPQFKNELEEKIQKEFDQIKFAIIEEQKHDRNEAGATPGGAAGQ